MSTSKLKALEAKRDLLLANQATVSDQFNSTLTKEGGLNDNSKMVRKNVSDHNIAQSPT